MHLSHGLVDEVGRMNDPRASCGPARATASRIDAWLIPSCCFTATPVFDAGWSGEKGQKAMAEGSGASGSPRLA